MTENPDMLNAALNTELQSILSTVAEYQALIRNAKTATKRQYYQQKLAKIRPAALNVLAAIDHVQSSVQVDGATDE